MTTWLEFRSEPLSDVPTINMSRRESDGRIVLTCNDIDCKWEEEAAPANEGPWQIVEHQQWHEDGCPE